MPNTLHPLEAWILRRKSVRRRIVDAFLEDGRLSPREQAVLDLIADEDEPVIAYRAREVAADSFKRNGDSRVTRERFHDAGHGLIDLDAERARRRPNVIAFPSSGRDAG